MCTRSLAFTLTHTVKLYYQYWHEPFEGEKISWCGNNLSLNVSKTTELRVDSRKKMLIIFNNTIKSLNTSSRIFFQTLD